ncbi:MAG: PSD1 and planctomycete cytochrome C domain-containing protein [Pirellulales bacterium]|nr:PSD1 and planctomycete cytochrome C domain-containing protein [Pirellulales bacterium]
MIQLTFALGLLLAALAAPQAAHGQEKVDPASADFFERDIRPLLIARCFECHGPDGSDETTLRLDSRDAMLQGGDRGPAIDLDRPEASLLLRAVRGDDADLKMPPDNPLSAAEVAALQSWLAAGAPFPKAVDGVISMRRPWSFAPLAAKAPGKKIDDYIREKLEQAGLQPAPRADKHALLRRATYDLTGLPPTESEIQVFLTDDSPDAFARVVDRLLVSPAYGERWGRHWLDIVRYSDTSGIDHDLDKPHVYRFRDYIIAAHNEDLPLNQLIREHLAGDLMPPRLSLQGDYRASPLGTAFPWFHEVLALPFDLPAARAQAAAELENQLDVFGRAFLGMTLGCARCHDHKFDPISTEDYYALGGFFTSATNQVACLDTPQQAERIEQQRIELAQIDRQRRELLARDDAQRQIHAARLAEGRRVADYLLATRQVLNRPTEQPLEVAVASVASSASLPEQKLERWARAVESALERRDPVLTIWRRIAHCSPAAFASRARTRARQSAADLAAAPRPFEVFADFEQEGYGAWTPVGPAFGSTPTVIDGAIGHGPQGQHLASSFRSAKALQGRLVSPRFQINDKPRYLCFWLAGGATPFHTCVNLIVHSQMFPQLPFWSVTGDGSDDFRLAVFDLQLFKDREAFIEIVDEATDGYVMADHFFFTDEAPADDVVYCNPRTIEALAGCASAEQLAQRYQALVLESLAQCDPAATVLVDDESSRQWKWWCLRPHSLLVDHSEAEALVAADGSNPFADLAAATQRLESKFPATTLALVSADWRPHDAQVQHRGDPEQLGDTVRRGAPAALLDWQLPASVPGSGRLELARQLFSDQNALTARVLANRVWAKHLGRGIVPTVDNFGNRGEPPSHPELLDYLAHELINSGWSLKHLHRLILASDAYQRSTQADPAAEAVDPQNVLLHRANVRRLDAEALRDSILTLAGTLDPTMYGPSVAGEEVPVEEAGSPPSIDSTGRRSIYLQVTRNAISPLLEAFDFPRETMTIGQRRVSIAPQQALVMMNSLFVAKQVELWAKSLQVGAGDLPTKLREMYLRAAGRPPLEHEERAMLDFLQGAPGDSAAQPSAEDWRAACHVLLNSNAFLFLN